jgi:succinoglycan biosynthesis transport protein ExoP
MEQKPKDFRDYMEFLKRRKKHLTIPFLCIFVIGAAVAVLLPSVYKSSTTILIEGQQIPTEFVRSTVTSFAEERIQNCLK